MALSKQDHMHQNLRLPGAKSRCVEGMISKSLLNYEIWSKALQLTILYIQYIICICM